MPADLSEAICNRDVDAVKGLLNVQWDRVKRRRMESVRDRDNYGPIQKSLVMCIDPEKRTDNDDQNQKSYEILDVVLEHGLSVGYADFSVCDNPFDCDHSAAGCSFFDTLREFGPNPGWLKVCEIYSKHGLPLLGAHTDITCLALVVENHFEVLKFLLEQGKPVISLALFQVAAVEENFNSDFCELFLNYKSPEFWSTYADEQNLNSVVDDVDFMLLDIATLSNSDVLRSLIEHGLPPTSHYTLVRCMFEETKCSLDFFDILLEHASPESKSFRGGSLSNLVKTYFPWSKPVNQQILQRLRDHPEKKLKSWSKRMHPGHARRGEDCAICYDIYKAGQKIVKLPCDHIFHLECMSNTLPMKQDTCPYCRQRYI